MSVIINGTDGVSTPNTFAFKNRLIDAGFIINQRGYTSGTALSAGSYGHDRWKAGSGGATYTFTQGSLGVNTTITITAGTLVQVIEGCNLAEGGTYVLSWTGTAQGRLNGGTYGASGTVVITGWTAGTNLNVEFNTGTLGSVQLETGNQATSFDYRPYGTELALCQRYYYKVGPTGTDGFTQLAFANITSTTNHVAFLPCPPMRTAATSIDYANIGFITQWGAGVTSISALTLQRNNPNGATLSATLSSALGSVGGVSIFLQNNNSGGYVALSAEL